MVCRKMIIGYFGGCDCEICLSINAKCKNNHCSKQKNSYKEITCVKNDVCMCKHCFEKLCKDNVTIVEGQENIEENIKKRIRKEMAEECHIPIYEIILLIYEKTYMSEKDASIHRQSCLDSILKIIRGD